MTEIAIAVVEFDGRFLIGMRPEGSPLAGYWEFPGGKLAPGETPQAAAARECREEIGIDVIIGEAYPEVVHEYDHGTLKLHFFKATPTEPSQPTSDRFIWVPRERLGEYRFPEANARLMETLGEELATPPRDARFWLGPAHALVLLVFVGLLMTSEFQPTGGTLLLATLVGLILLLAPLVNHALLRPARYSLRQFFFDLTALAVTATFVQAAGWSVLLIWIPLLLLRRL